MKQQSHDINTPWIHSRKKRHILQAGRRGCPVRPASAMTIMKHGKLFMMQNSFSIFEMIFKLWEKRISLIEAFNLRKIKITA